MISELANGVTWCPVYDVRVRCWSAAHALKHNCLLFTARFQWDPYDPEIVANVLFALANVLSFARTTYLMPSHELLGPLQISLGRMMTDIIRFMVLFVLVSGGHVIPCRQPP